MSLMQDIQEEGNKVGLDIRENTGEVWVRSDVVASTLSKEFLGLRLNAKGHWPENEFATVEKALVDNDIAAIEQSDIYKKREVIRNATLDKEAVQAVIGLQEALNSDYELVREITEGLYHFQEARLQALHVSDRKIKVAIAHEKTVEGTIDYKIPLARLIASVHDISKYSGRKIGEQDGFSVYEDNPPHLGLHETASAVLAGDVMRTVFGNPRIKERIMDKMPAGSASWEQVVESFAKVTEIAVANHGHMEYPHKKSTPVEKEKGINKLFGNQLYLENYRPVNKIVAEDVGEQNFSQIEQIIEGIREADMVVGADPVSYVKYHEDVKPEDLIKAGSSYNYIFSYADTFIEYFNDAPDVLGIGEQRQATKERGALLFAVLKAVDSDPAQIDRIRSACVAAFGENAGPEIIGYALEMKNLFDSLTTTEDVTGEKPDPEKFKQLHLQQFNNLVAMLYSAENSQFQNDQLKTIVAESMDSLKDEVRQAKTSPAK